MKLPKDLDEEKVLKAARFIKKGDPYKDVLTTYEIALVIEALAMFIKEDRKELKK